ncbi:MAG: dynamin family protein [Acetobacter sp.]|nr:dynamin family protein [Bacteroides sp.]MCM1340956.1 dynamin family protein [Acetobacter sp.]MCM1432488.1 dynamin family protein [Clostridiales bacterium]
MKFGDLLKKAKSQNNTTNGEREKLEDFQETIGLESNGEADKFITSLYNTTSALLQSIKPIIEKYNSDVSDKAYTNTVKALENLKDFEYNIGFAGEQSCGKSTLINAIIKYPLMATCNLPTTGNVVQLKYGKNIHISVFDNKEELVKDFNCSNFSTTQYNSLLSYICAVMPIMLIENICYFTDKINTEDLNSNDIASFESVKLSPSDIDMNNDNPKHIAILLLILLSVYVGEDNREIADADKRHLIDLRTKTFKFFGLNDSINYSITVHWNSPFLKQGLVITDLPGLGARAKEHDNITQKAIEKTDAIAFIATPELRNAGTPVLENLLSNEDLKGVVSKNNRIVPIINQADRLNKSNAIQTINEFLGVFSASGIEMEKDNIHLCSGLYGEYSYASNEIPLERTMFYNKNSNSPFLKYSQDDPKLIIKEMLKKEFDNSGINKLNTFFYTTFIEKGKFSKSVEVLNAVKSLYMTTAFRMKNDEKNFAASCEIDANLLADINGNAQRRITKITSDNIKTIDRELDKIKNETIKSIEKELKNLPVKYDEMIQTSFSQYKNNLMEIIKKLPFNNLLHLNSCCIEKPDAKKVYEELVSAKSNVPIEFKNVNFLLKNIFEIVTIKVNEMFLSEIKILDASHKTIVEQLNLNNEYEKNADAAIHIDSLKQSMIGHIDEQVVLANAASENKQKEIINFSSESIQKIINQNNQVVQIITEVLSEQIDVASRDGMLFDMGKRYLVVDGNRGIKGKVTTLKLPDEIYAPVINDIYLSIRENIKIWLRETVNSISGVNEDFRHEVAEQIKKTTVIMKEQAFDKKTYLKELHENSNTLTSEFSQYNKKILPEIKQAIKISGDNDLKNFKGNLFK